MRSLPLSQFIIGLFSLLILVTSLSKYGGVSSYGAGFMPTILSALLLAFTALDALIHLRQRRQTLALSGDELRSLGLVIVSLGLFTWLLDSLGFFICAALLLLGLMCLRNPKKWRMNLVYSLLSAAVINYVFGHVLMVALPQAFWS